MIIVNTVYGHCDDALWSGICTELAARGRLEVVPVDYRRSHGERRRATTDKGTVVGLALGETLDVRSGSVLFYQEAVRIVLARARGDRLLVIAPLNQFTPDECLCLGHYLGTLGWQARVVWRLNHMEITVPCTDRVDPEVSGGLGDATCPSESTMDAQMRSCPVQNICWTFRDRCPTDP